MTETVVGLPAGYRTTFAKVMRMLAMVTGTLAVVQFALAGFGAFGSFSHHRNWGPHETLGTSSAILALLTMIAAIVARPGRLPLIAAITLLVVAGPVQPILADAGKDHAWVGALHALGGIAILAMCGIASRKIELADCCNLGGFGSGRLATSSQHPCNDFVDERSDGPDAAAPATESASYLL